MILKPACYEELDHMGKKMFDLMTSFKTEDEDLNLELDAITGLLVSLEILQPIPAHRYLL